MSDHGIFSASNVKGVLRPDTVRRRSCKVFFTVPVLKAIQGLGCLVFGRDTVSFWLQISEGKPSRAGSRVPGLGHYHDFASTSSRDGRGVSLVCQAGLKSSSECFGRENSSLKCYNSVKQPLSDEITCALCSMWTGTL